MVPISIELFSGSCTVSSVLSRYGFDTYSVDNNPKLNPRICCDILDLNPGQLPGQCAFLWASPDCRYFSRNGDAALWSKRVIKYRKYEYTPLCYDTAKALLLIYKTIEIIRTVAPSVWFIENPIGRLRHIPELKSFAPFRYSVNYKDWGFDYSKETDIYSNVYLSYPQKKVQRFGRSVVSVNSKYKRSIVPANLIIDILNQCLSLKLFSL